MKKIYNPLEISQNLSGCKLRKKTQSGSEYSIRSFPSDTNISAKEYVLWATSVNNYYLEVSAELYSSAYLSSNNSVGFFDESYKDQPNQWCEKYHH